MDKKAIADAMKLKRASLLQDEKKALDHTIQKHLMFELEPFDSIALFASFNHEVNLWPVIEGLWKQKKIYLPRVNGKTMDFYRVQSREDLRESSFGILEPKEYCEIVCKTCIDIIVVPMLAFDLNLYRIGYGGGYYDRFLKDYNGYALGIAYSFQAIDYIPIESHDVKCDNIMTEKEKL
ncbi:5-formyltetrahydrofolate cyclo-ligase [Erysipelothrix urinaevulpis]|uniref:5-formyltetrahydrofolate cyclo-ligase n=1 Tax=Erysipelothrix urinaevulpis TaxID=2683717 RepID=UPI001357786A|nr:5-formyltetrahydrofolate cyclo-ligase [Erysipelothrix urinaevulpis]